VYGVSLDKQESKGGKQDWQEAIIKDGLAWTNVSDLQYWNSKAAQMYNIKSIPSNFLLDKTGKVIAKNLRGQELINKLKELMP
jgi:hypothetical protein